MIIIICCIQVGYCFDFSASGSVNLTKDDGWSQFGAACVGYLETNNFSAYGGAAGIVDIEFTVPFTAPTDTEYRVVFYDDQENSFPMVNRTDLICEERIVGYYRLMEVIRLEPGQTWTRTVSIHQHIQTRWWYFYLVNCNESLTFSPIPYTYSYRDNKSDTEICPKPSNITTTTTTTTTTKPSNISTTTTQHTTSDSNTKALIIIGVNIIIIAIIGIFIGVCVNYMHMNKKRNKHSGKKENLLMESLNEQDIPIPGVEDPNNLLTKWSLQQYGNILINERGYDDIEQWRDLNESDLQQMGFKEGHSVKFVKKVKEYFMDVLVEEDPEVADNVTNIVVNNVMIEEMVGNNESENEGEGYTNQ